MSVSLNRKGKSHAASLISHGKVSDAPWSFDSDDGNKLLGPNGTDWDSYSSWHLGLESDAEQDTKAHYKYPFGKEGKVYMAALRAIRSRSSQQGVTSIFNAAGELLKAAKGDEEKGLIYPQLECRFLSATVKMEHKMPMPGMPDMPEDEMPEEDSKSLGTLVGYATLYNEPVVFDNWVEYVMPGSLDETLKTQDVISAWNHNTDFLLGRTSAGTLQLSADEKGLQYKCKLPKHFIGQYVSEMFGRGDVSGLSIMFSVENETWDTSKEPYTRLINKITLYECGPVHAPAQPKAKASLRAQEHVAELLRAKQDNLELRLRLAAL